MGYFGNPYQMGYNPYSGYAPASPQNGAGAMQGFAGQITRVNGANGVANLNITAIVRNACGCDGSLLSLVLDGVASVVNNLAVTVEKL